MEGGFQNSSIRTMKSQFSSSWISSRQPRKQRKFRYNAPLQVKHKFLSAHLSKSLRKQHGKRSLPLRKGDEVLIMRGSFKKKKAKIISVDLRHGKVCIEGMQKTKRDGSKVNVPFSPSILMIQELSLEDKNRLASSSQKKTSSSSKGEKENASN